MFILSFTKSYVRFPWKVWKVICTIILEKLVLYKRISGEEAGTAKQYSSFLRIRIETQQEWFYSHSYRNRSERLQSMTIQWTFSSFFLIPSHGQAQVECRFSINSNILVENHHLDSLIAQRRVNDYMGSQNLQPYELPMTKKLLTNGKNARSRYLKKNVMH